MADPGERVRELEAALSASEEERKRLERALERAEARIAELEQARAPAPRREGTEPRSTVEVARKSSGASAWDRAVASMRQQRGEPSPRSPEPPRAAPAKRQDPPRPPPVAAAPPVHRERPPEIQPPADGPCLLDVIETDPGLTAGQREALRSTYLRLRPSARPRGDSKHDPALSVGAALDLDPGLTRGQREAIRAVVSSMGRARG